MICGCWCQRFIRRKCNRRKLEVCSSRCVYQSFSKGFHIDKTRIEFGELCEKNHPAKERKEEERFEFRLLVSYVRVRNLERIGSNNIFSREREREKMQSTCQQQQAQPGQNGTSASRTSFLIEDILSRGTQPPHSHHQLHHQHLAPGHGVQHQQYQQFASLLPGYPSAPPTATFFLGPLFGNTAMGVGVVPGVTELAALKHCRRRKARTVSGATIPFKKEIEFFEKYHRRKIVISIDYISRSFEKIIENFPKFLISSESNFLSKFEVVFRFDEKS